jgi:hypothetical protein
MSDTFVPMGPTIIPAAGNGFTPLPLKPAPFAANKTAPAANGHATAAPATPPPPAQNCASPKVTLQKQGEVVTGIRIQCGCGQVIELSCVY